MKIGFFGDSFCQDIDSDYNYDTYIKKLANHYNAEITSTGVGGTSIWDTILIQFEPYRINLPDVCVFVWSDPSRLFNRSIRGINSSSFLNKRIKHIPQHSTAIKLYYQHIYDIDHAIFSYTSALYYFDNVVLNNITTDTKFIHMWSFGESKDMTAITTGHDSMNHDPRYKFYLHDWKTGIELRPPLASISITESKNIRQLTSVDPRPNHLDGEEKNELVFNWIKHAIDSYEVGKCLDFRDDVIALREVGI